jgi:hypothetical protein
MRPVTYRYRPVALPQTGIEVPDVLVSVCDVCDRTVGIPAQSLPKVQVARERATRSVEARIPKELDDALGIISDRLHARPDAFRGALIRYYVTRIARDPAVARHVCELARSHEADGTPGGRISTRIEVNILGEATQRVRALGLRYESDMYRGIILAALLDTFDGGDPANERRAALEAIAAATI